MKNIDWYFVLGVVCVICFVLLILYGPGITIWSINTLFNTTIPYNWSTWFAVLWLSGPIFNKFNGKKS